MFFANHSKRRSWARAGLPLVVAAFALGVAPVSAAVPSSDWTMGGQNLANTRYNAAESTINPSNASTLATKWTFTTHGDVSATPAVSGNVAYFPDWGGYLNAVNTKTGKVIWQVPIASYESSADAANMTTPAVSRTSPALSDNTLYIGDQGTGYHDASGASHGAGAHLFAINVNNGQLKWRATLDSHPAAIDTQAPAVYNGVVYVGVASQEEALAQSPTYPCCSFRGSEVALNANTGKQIWKTYTISSADLAAGYSGNAVWGGMAAIDAARNSVYISTGNDYTQPVGGCSGACDPAQNHFDSVMALDLSTGAIKWATPVELEDTWTVGCINFLFGQPVANCQSPASPDYDFGSGATLLSYSDGSGQHQVVGAGQKSGIYWEFDPGTGAILHGGGVKAGPGSSLGGIEWGASSDGTRIYVAEANYGNALWTLQNGHTICGGFWVALDPATLHVLWQTPDPRAVAEGDIPDANTGQCPFLSNNSAVDIGAVTSANGVVYAGSVSGHMYAMSGGSGAILADLPGQGASAAGPAVVNGVVYWGNGYAHLGLPGFAPSNTFYAFSPAGQ